MKKKLKIRIRNKRRIMAFLVCFLLIAALSLIVLPLNKVNGTNIVTYREYTIKAGDTIWSIASNINDGNMDIREIVFDIKDMNKLDSVSFITEGQQLMLPVYN